MTSLSPKAYGLAGMRFGYALGDKEVIGQMSATLLPWNVGTIPMWAALAAGDYEKAAAEMLDSKWAVQVGNRSRELARQMRVGEWQTKAPSMNDSMEG